MKFQVVLIAAGLLLFHCQPVREEIPSAITFVTKDFRVTSAGGCSADTLLCAYYAVSYPEFSGLDSAVASTIRRELDAMVSMGNPEASAQTMEEIGAGFIRNFEDFKNEMPDIATGWHYAAAINVEVLVDTLISLSLSEEYYTGGAHGGVGHYYLNVVPSTGDQFTLERFLKPGFEAPLNQLGEKIFRAARGIPAGASLEDHQFEFPGNNFRLNDNYGFKEEGIAFFFNSYEIASYAAGPTEVVIPYASLAAWIR